VPNAQNSMRLSCSIVGIEESTAIARVIQEDGYLGMGTEVKKFEEEIATFLGVSPHEVACVNTGTSALHLAVQAVTNPGDEILVQSLTYVATFQAISAAGAIPVACEILPDDMTIDLSDAEKHLTPKTKAIMPVHYASNPGALDKIYAFAKKYHLRVIEDAAQAFGCLFQGKKIGSFGDVRCFSFDGIKNITSGEGGAIISSDPKVLSRVCDARLLGVEKDTEKRFSGERSWEFDVTRQGYRYHMSNIFAALGRVQLQRFIGEFAPKRVQLAQQYVKRLQDVPGIKLLNIELGAVVPHIQVVRILKGLRDEVRSALEKNSIPSGIHYKPNHLLSFYGGGKNLLPVTEQVYKELLTLPLHPGLSVSDVDSVCDVVLNVLKEKR